MTMAASRRPSPSFTAPDRKLESSSSNPTSTFASSTLRSLTAFSVPSFSSFRSRTSSSQTLLQAPPRRTVSLDATPPLLQAPSFAKDQHSRHSSLDSPAPGDSEREPAISWQLEDGAHSSLLIPRDLDSNPHGSTPLIAEDFDFSFEDFSIVRAQPGFRPTSSSYGESIRPPLNRSQTSYHTAQNSISDGGQQELDVPQRSRSRTMSSSSKDRNLTLQVDNRAFNRDTDRGPKSPGKVVSSFFGWKSRNPAAESPTTTFSDSRSVSPSPMSTGYQNGIQDHQYNDNDESYSSRAPSPMPYGNQQEVGQVDDLLRELREVGVELASSIRREMELEDEVERYKAEASVGSTESGRRTSDYYSDSGASSVRLPVADTETKMEGLEKMRRKAEQEKAQLRTEMAQKMQEDLNQRRALEMHIQTLEEQVRIREFHAEAPVDKQRELEVTLEDVRRRLNEERQLKQNFEDLLTGMQEEARSHRNERDNLRDEIVPQLRAQLEGMEAEVAKLSTVNYEKTRMEQELHSLRNENQTLVNARRLQLDLQNSNPRFKAISESPEIESPTSSNFNLSRSNSLARTKSLRHRSGSLTKGQGTAKEQIPIEALPERLKDVEDQRDALHRTLKALIVRQEVMTRKHRKAIREMAVERDRALSSTPRRAAFALEVQSLRHEINHLRRRADDAVEQKWQCEKGLSGIKMDLDRAQQETSSLRDLLRERDIFVPDRPSSSEGNSEGKKESLDEAFAALRAVHGNTLAQLQRSEVGNDDVKAAEDRMTVLSKQIQKQLSSNNDLQERLAGAIGRGEKEQEASTKKLMDLESALREAEERVMNAQSESEEAVAQQEEHIKEMKDAQSEQTLRGISSPQKPQTPTTKNVGLGLNVPTSNPSKSPGLFAARSPRLEKTTSGKAQSVMEVGKAQALELRVRELEEAARHTEREMHGVVERMNKAQIEVAELQTQRDEATRQTRRLQREIIEERERVKAMAV